MTDLPLTGGCHCGAVRYEVRAAPRMVLNCHCTNCQKITGSAFATNAYIDEASFAFTKGEPKIVRWTADSGTERWGAFCGDCGSRIAHGSTPSKGGLALRGGTLDDVSWLEPVADIWTDSAQPWVEFPESRARFPKQHTDAKPLFAAFEAQGHFPKAD